MSGGAMLFRVIEDEDGMWSCRHGSMHFDTHKGLVAALEHIAALAAAAHPADVLLHRRDGTIHHLDSPNPAA